MGVSIMQGDSYQKPFTLRTLDGTLITPEMVTAQTKDYQKYVLAPYTVDGKKIGSPTETT